MNEPHDNLRRDEQLDEVITAYLEAVSAGRPPERSELLARHPALADELRSFFEDDDAIRTRMYQREASLHEKRPGTTNDATIGEENQDARSHDLPEGIVPTDRSHFGEYELLEKLGEGGMGVVYKARHIRLKRVVALKMILSGRRAREAELKRFRIEAEAVARLQHPGVVQIFEVGEHEDQPFLALEYVGGGSLEARLRAGPMSAKEAAQLVRQLAEAMAAAHCQHIIHRDLKPANVLLSGEWQVAGGENTDSSSRATRRSLLAPTPKITDFGLAKKLDEREGLTHTHAILGTPSYMAPEQAAGAGAEVGPAADIYAMGAILYELLTGRPPFRATTPIDTLMQVVREEPVPPRQVRSDIPRDLETICLKCLEKDPNRRYATAEDLAEELGRFLSGEPILARAVGRVERVWRWCKRYPSVAILAALVFLALAAGTVISSLFAAEARRNEEEALRLANDKAELAQRALTLAGEKDQLARKETAARTDAEREIKAKAWHLYVARLFPMADAFEKRDFGRLEQLLEESEPKAGELDFRGWEWHYLRDQCRRASVLLSGEAPLLAHPDWCRKTGKIAAPAGSHIEIWDGQTLKREKILKTTGWAARLSWDPDGKRIAYTTNGTTAYIVTVADGTTSPPLEGHTSGIQRLVWSPDGKRIASFQYEGLINLWDAQEARLIRAMPVPAQWRMPVYSIDWHPDSVRLAIGCGRHTTVVWDTDRDKLVSKWDGPTSVTAWDDRFTCVAWSPDGDKLAAAHESNTLVTDAKGRVLHSVAGKATQSMQWSPDGKRLVLGSNDQSIKVWDITTAEVRTIRVHRSIVQTVRWSPDGQRVLSASQQGGVRITSLSGEDTTARRVITATRVQDVAWRPKLRAIACAPQGLIIDAATGKTIHTLKDFTGRFLAWSPDGNRLLAVAHGAADLWDGKTGTRMGRHQVAVSYPAQRRGGIAWSPDGKVIAFANDAGKVSLWDPALQNIARLELDGSPLLSVALSPDGRHLAAGWKAGVCVWEIPTQRLIHKMASGNMVDAIAYSPDGEVIVAGDVQGVVFFYRAADGELIRTLPAHHGPIAGVSYSANGQRLATLSTYGTVKIWDAATGIALLTLECSARASAIAWSHDNRSLAVACADGVRIFEADAAMPGAGYGEDVQFAQRATGLTVAGPRDMLDKVKKGEEAGEQLVARFLVRLGHMVRIDDEWIADEKKLPREKRPVTGVKLVSLANTTPLVVEQLASLDSLRVLELDVGSLDVARLTVLGELKSVRELTLTRPLVGATLGERLQRLPNLEKLTLAQASFTPDGVDALSTLKHLGELSLRGANVTDQMMRKRDGLQHLKKLDLTDTPVTQETAEWLRKRFADTQVVHAAHAEDRQAAEWVVKLGGKLKILDAGARKHVMKGEELPAYPFRILEIDLDKEAEVTDADLERLKDLSALEKLTLRGRGISDDGLEKLRSLAALRSMTLSNTSVRGTGFRHLAHLKELRAVAVFGGACLNDDGLVQVGELKGLTQLIFTAAAITDEGLGPLAKLRSLEHLHIGSGSLNGEGLRHLSGLPKLQALYLDNHQFTDNCLVHLGKITTLKRLLLNGNKGLTDDGMRHLYSLQNLSALFLGDTSVTQAGKELLRLKIAGCKVE